MLSSNNCSLITETNNKIMETTEEVENARNYIGKEIPNYKKYKWMIWEFETPLMWHNIILIFMVHILAVYALYDWASHSLDVSAKLVLFSTVVGLLSGFGITAGAHRYWTHRSYKAKLPLRILLLFCYTLAGQNSVLEWVRDHRVHHKYTETDADPHNSKRGFFFAHVGWLMMKKHPDVLRKGRTVDCNDLFDDPLLVYHQKYFMWLKILLCFITPVIIPPLVWGELWYYSFMANNIRYVLDLNMTWSVNSFAHIWGYKPYNKNISPAENLSVALLALGEGYHNYHHTFPWDYRTSEMGKMLNATTLFLNSFAKLGWAYDLKYPTDDLIREVVKNHGDGSYRK